MKEKEVLEKTMHFLVHNSFQFTVAIMCLVHAALLLITWYAGVLPLTFFNILSVVVYLFCVLLCRMGQIMPVYLSILLEVTAYAVTSVYYIGWESGSYFFLFSIVPIIIYFGCFLFKGSKRWIVVAILAMNFIIFSLLYIGHATMMPVYKLSDNLRIVMTLFSSFAMFFSIVFYSSIYINVSEYKMGTLEEENEQLAVNAKEDSLTCLLNRRGFLPLVENLMKDEDPEEFCIALFDIDNFKRINDTYGHDCGDEVLLGISKIIKKELPDCDICRWGGEEFVILMRNYEVIDAKRKMEEIRRIIESTPTVFYNKRIPATITVGVAEYSDVYKTPEELIKIADERMYYGKQHGKNIVIFEDKRKNLKSG